MPYSFEDIKAAYKKIGVTKGKVVLVKSDLRYLGAFEGPGRSAVLEAHFRALAELVDLGVGTIVVPTSSTDLCNTDIPFDPDNTPSMRGILTNFIRKQPDAVRSHHAFFSHAAIGAQANTICKNVSRNCYGPESAKGRMLELDAMYVNIGIVPRETCAYVHYMEMIMGVPYRYCKEFHHPVIQPDLSIEKELFYIYVYYRGLDLSRNRNVNLFNYLSEKGYQVNQASLGDGSVYSCSCTEFCKLTAKYFRDNIYGWLNYPPEKRPYRE